MKPVWLPYLAALVLAHGACDSDPDGPVGGGLPDGGGTSSDITAQTDGAADTGAQVSDSTASADANKGGVTDPVDVPEAVDAGPDIVDVAEVDVAPPKPDLFHDPKAVCPPPGPYGEALNEIVRNFQLEDCATGKPLKAHDLCGAQAFWFYFTAGW